MDKDYIRRLTAVIVERDRKYLSGICQVTGKIIWSNSAYDAWSTRNLDTAMRIAWKVGGSIRLFNPIVGKVKKLRLSS